METHLENPRIIPAKRDIVIPHELLRCFCVRVLGIFPWNITSDEITLAKEILVSQLNEKLTTPSKIEIEKFFSGRPYFCKPPKGSLTFYSSSSLICATRENTLIDLWPKSTTERVKRNVQFYFISEHAVSRFLERCCNIEVHIAEEISKKPEHEMCRKAIAGIRHVIQFGETLKKSDVKRIKKGRDVLSDTQVIYFTGIALFLRSSTSVATVMSRL